MGEVAVDFSYPNLNRYRSFDMRTMP